MKSTVIFVDGSCAPKNPNGNVGIGIVAYLAENFSFNRSLSNKRDVKSAYTSIKKIYEHSNLFLFGSPGFEQTSNNMAEHLSLTHALEFVASEKYDNVTIFSDSEIMIKHMTGEYSMKAKGIYYESAKINKGLHNELTKRGCVINFEWIPREFNSLADELSNKI